MRVAIQSRCDHYLYRLPTLLPDATKKFCRTLSKAHGMRFDEPILALLSVAS